MFPIMQLLLFRDKREMFGTPQAQRACSQMNPGKMMMMMMIIVVVVVVIVTFFGII